MQGTCPHDSLFCFYDSRLSKKQTFWLFLLISHFFRFASFMSYLWSLFYENLVYHRLVIFAYTNRRTYIPHDPEMNVYKQPKSFLTFAVLCLLKLVTS